MSPERLHRSPQTTHPLVPLFGSSADISEEPNNEGLGYGLLLTVDRWGVGLYAMQLLHMEVAYAAVGGHFFLLDA